MTGLSGSAASHGENTRRAKYCSHPSRLYGLTQYNQVQSIIAGGDRVEMRGSTKDGAAVGAQRL